MEEAEKIPPRLLASIPGKSVYLLEVHQVGIDLVYSMNAIPWIIFAQKVPKLGVIERDQTIVFVQCGLRADVYRSVATAIVEMNKGQIAVTIMPVGSQALALMDGHYTLMYMLTPPPQ
jgi:hypothetical protein